MESEHKEIEEQKEPRAPRPPREPKEPKEVKNFDGDILPENMPVFRVAAGEHYLPALMVVTGQAKANGDGRRLIENSGVSFDGVKVRDPNAKVVISGEHILRSGKRNFARIAPEA